MVVTASFPTTVIKGREPFLLQYIPLPAQLSHRGPWATRFFVDDL
jgi:hypothetical protein